MLNNQQKPNYMKKLLQIILGALIVGFINITASAQSTVSGKVTDQGGEALIGVNIVEKGTSNGTTTDISGSYRIQLNNADATLVYSFIGYDKQEVVVNRRSIIDITLQESSLSLSEITVVGSRNVNRTATETPVPVDIIDVQELTTNSGVVEINQLLQYAAPSFNATKQTGSDGADHVDPAALRGLGPDQTLVLINGKRRHQSSLINVFGTRGRGNTGTDLNTIPAAAIKRIEILRDGASAQYGSDAIAGVINIVLKDNIGEFTGGITYGAYYNNPDGDFPEGTPNTDGNRLDVDRNGNAIDSDDPTFDGVSTKISANYGVGVGEDGFVNVTSEFISKNKTLRPGFDFRRGFGEAAIDGFNLTLNSAIPLSTNTEFYVFGIRNFRDTDAYAFTRNNPTERNVLSIYPNGFTPRITSNITDNSLSAGIRTETESDWKIDFNHTYGKNNFHYFIKGTLNASLEDASPTDFDAGGHSLTQNTSGLNLTKYFQDAGVNLAFGLEHRTETFEIFAGEAGSYGTFDDNGVLITNPAIQTVPTVIIGSDTLQRPGGSQGFPGYGPANEVDRSRTNFAMYADGEIDITDNFLIGVATRYEYYSDFGSTLTGKLAARVSPTDNLSLRGSVSTGFRAPSLAQIYYNLRFTDFQGGVASETLLSPNNSPVTKSFGIEDLQEENALNASLGVVSNFGDFTLTVDGYFIEVEDRIVLTGTFDASSLGINVSEAQFFANAADTRSKGLDVVLSWRGDVGTGQLNASLAGNFNDMEITKVKNEGLDEETFFGKREKGFLLASAPDYKVTANFNYNLDPFSFGLSFTQFSEIELVDFADGIDTYEARGTVDFTAGWQMTDNIRFTIGGNNIFNTYPTQQNDGETEAGGYWDSVQMGFSGAYYYGRLGLTF